MFAIMAVLPSAATPLPGAMHTASGCVKDEHGAPIPGAIVHVKELEGPLRLAVATDAHGCYKQASLPDAAYEILAEQNGVIIDRKQIVLDEKKRNAIVDLQYRPGAKPASAGDPAPPMINLTMLAAGGPRAARPGSGKSSWLQSVSFNLSHVDGGDPAMGKVSLSKPAPSAGLLVNLSVSNAALAEAPPEITIPAGLTGAWFTIKTTRVSGPADVRVKVTASDGEGAESAELGIFSYTRITLHFQGDGSGIVVSTPAGIRCAGGVCSVAFRDDESVQLMPQPEPGSVFQGWSGDCSQEGLVVVSGPMNCTATFGRQ